MKLRQKLAVVLASAMVVTAVPVVTMAASTTSVTKTITVANEDPLGAVAPALNIKLTDAVTTRTQFYITLENAKFNKTNDVLDAIAIGSANTANGVSVVATSETEATVVVDPSDKDKIISISLSTVKVTGEAKISVDGNDTEISSTSSPIVFANKSDSKAVVTVKDDTKFFTTSSAGEKVGTIVITEQVAGSLLKDADADRTIEIEMEHSDFEFVAGTVTLKGSKGFSSYGSTTLTGTLDKDKQTLTLVLPKVTDPAGKGVWEISNLRVKSLDKSPETGDLNVSVEGKNDTKVEYKEVKVATVAEYGTELTVAEKKTIKSGKDEKVKITYKEVTADSTAKGEVEFTLDKGYFEKANLKKELGISDDDLIYKDMKDKKDDELIGFVIKTAGKDSDVEKFIDGKELKVITKLDTEGDITLSTYGRYVEEQTVVVAEAKPNFTIKAEAMTLKVGQSKQVGGKLVITENEKGAFAKNSVITLNLADEDGISFTELPKVTVDGSSKVKVDWKNGKSTTSAIEITLTKASKDEPATITVEGVEVKVDRTVPQGTYELKLGVSDYNGELKSKDFFVVGTPNVEELAANGLPKGTAAFTIGSKEYTINGKVATMDAAAYIQDPGYTMVPVRYVATAFGVSEKDILFSAGTATIFAGSRTVQLTAGSDVAIVNGASIKLATKVVVKDGRTYAPVGEVAKILGITPNWDATTKVATFENK
ncbi:stalk domain-containing protein [Cellulosilyticum sp. ST5]|uniref:stalk domain-containing protein n=1 Tax=unclassified Cellulosilyticum TaxID=2643091 RepID=UPI000F8CD45E|nr:stalk domain-containing protein [Cellulosilyticum sp. WCF-2]QEH66986.1 copper amine oxidase N-terminal domain-containing protein [Cellulosilyticum sp. WCF-2]